jgi:hypothetical protein
MTVRRGQLVGWVIGGSLTVALLSICAGLLLIEALAEPPTALVIALLIVFTLRVLVDVRVGTFLCSPADPTPPNAPQ